MSSFRITPTTKVTHILSHLKSAAGPQEREDIRTKVREALTEGRLDGETVALLLSSSDFLAQPRAGKVDAISQQAEALFEASKQRQTKIKEPTFQDLERSLATPGARKCRYTPYNKAAKASESRFTTASSSSSATTSSTSSALPDGSRVLSIPRVMQRTQGMPQQQFEMPGGSSLGVMNFGMAATSTPAMGGYSPHRAGPPMPHGPHTTCLSTFQLQLPANGSAAVAPRPHPQAPAMEQFPPPIGAYMAPLRPYAYPLPAQAVYPAQHSSPHFSAVPRALAVAPPANPSPSLKVHSDGMSAYLDYGIPVARRKQEETQSSTVDTPDDHGSCTGEEASENASPPKEPMAVLRELEDVMAELDGEAMKDIALEIYRMLTEGQGATSSVQ